MSSKFTLKIRDHIGEPERKKIFNEMHFTEAASRYDLATRAMSLGRDSAWKRHLVAALPEAPAPFCVDLACGTGDVALLLAEKYPGGSIVGVDITESMLEVARERNCHDNLRFTRQNMNDTDFSNERIDIITGSYALRNAPGILPALSEIHRILKPGGVAAFLDFAKPATPFLQSIQYLLLKIWLGFWGLTLHGNHEVHGYVASSLETYPDRLLLRKLLRVSGFEITFSRRFYFGILELMVIRKSPYTE